MQNKNSAVELIKKYQRLFTDLNHSQIAERLVRLVVTKPVFSRVVLVVERNQKLYVEAVGSCRDPRNIITQDTEIEKVNHLPISLIQKCFFSATPYSLDLSVPHSLARTEYQIGSKALYLHPIVENNQVIAVFHMESEMGLVTLSRSVQDIDTVWAFSAFLVRQIIELWQHEEQLEKYRLAEQALWASETYLKAILHHSPALISVKDLTGKVVLASDHYKELQNVGEEGFVGKNVHDVYPSEIAEVLWENDNTVMEEAEAAHGLESEFEVQHKNGSYHTYLMVKFPLCDKQNQIFGVCTICTDITERKQAEDALRTQQSRLNYLAFHDALTGLPNRTLFYDRISQGLARALRSESKLVLMLLDLDRFKNINDSLGHDAGDLLLKTISQRLHDGIRDMDTVARLGGDEFVVVLEGIHDQDDVTYVATKMLATLACPMNIHGHEIATTVSIGISIYPQDGDATDELLKHADIAMYKAKEAGKNNYQFYTPGMNATAVNFLLLENDLRRAIEQDQLYMYYQPQIDLQTSSLMGVEALVRWQHPQRGLVGPIEFISLAEETGLIVPLGEWVLRTACKQQKAWLQAGNYVGKIAVNISARQFRDPKFAERIADILMETELPAKYLELEITESSAMEHAGETINMLNRLNQMGLSLAIDDFGTGYSSLAYLKRFPIQKLKIDRSFISDIYTDQDDASIARSIIGLAHNMMLNVVAEGVENENQAEWLRCQGCDQVQGFLYAQPMPASRFEAFFNGGTFSFKSNVIKLEVPA